MSKIKGDQTPAPFNVLSGVLVQALTSPLKLADHGEQFVQFTSCFIAPWFTFHFVIISLLCMFGTQECYSSQTNAGIRYRDNDGLRLFFFSLPVWFDVYKLALARFSAPQLLLPPAWSPFAHRHVLWHLVHRWVMSSRCETRPIITWLLFVMCKALCPLSPHSSCITPLHFFATPSKTEQRRFAFPSAVILSCTCTGAGPSHAHPRLRLRLRLRLRASWSDV